MMALKTGDIIKTDFSPTSGHEQSGYRPAMVVSVEDVHIRTGMVWVLPITSATDKFPTHLALQTKNDTVTGTVLCEHIKSIDPTARGYKKVDEATHETILKCKKVIDAITYI